MEDRLPNISRNTPMSKEAKKRWSEDMDCMAKDIMHFAKTGEKRRTLFDRLVKIWPNYKGLHSQEEE